MGEWFILKQFYLILRSIRIINFDIADPKK